ncbi:MAG: MFS transporter [Solirubrobacteraceae bacterium]
MTAVVRTSARGAGLHRNPGYRRLWFAAVVSQTGDWLLFIALPLAVLSMTGSVLATSTVFLAELLPAVLTGLLGGPLIDRPGAHRLLARLTAAQAVVVMPLLWLSPGRLWLVYLVAGLQAAITSITLPGQQALVPALVDAAALPRANGLVEMAGNVARLAGSPLGGVLLPIVGLDGLVAGDAVSFLISALLLAGCGPSRPAPAPARPGAGQRRSAGGGLRAISEGWGAVRRSPMLAAGVAVSLLGGIAQGLFLVLFVLFVLRSLHHGDDVVGLLRGVQAIGGVAGGLLVGAWARRAGTRRLTVWGLAAFGCVSLVTWNSPQLTTNPAWYAALFIVVGVPATAFVTGLVTELQLVCPAPVLGRVLSLVGVAQAAGQGAGVLAAGVLSGAVPLAVLLNGQGCLYLAGAAVAALGFQATRTHRSTAGMLLKTEH